MKIYFRVSVFFFFFLKWWNSKADIFHVSDKLVYLKQYDQYFSCFSYFTVKVSQQNIRNSENIDHIILKAVWSLMPVVIVNDEITINIKSISVIIMINIFSIIISIITGNRLIM